VGKLFRVLFVLFVILYVLIHIFPSLDDADETTEETEEVTEFQTADFDTTDSLDQDVIVTHSRVWQDADGSRREIAFGIPLSASEASFKYRDTVQVEEDGTEKTFWRNLYYDLYDHDKRNLAPLQDSIIAFAGRNGIQKSDLIYSIVTMIQDIRYNYVLQDDSCLMHEDFPCLPLEPYGILPPVGFMYTLSGDCDTRTVLLFTILKNLGYDPIIVNSAQYGHSMLAVDIPSQGDYFIHKGRKFYFWETTSTGWAPGMLPPEMNNIDYWTIILDYEFETDPTRAY
jgi:hypothetical protein